MSSNKRAAYVKNCPIIYTNPDGQSFVNCPIPECGMVVKSDGVGPHIRASCRHGHRNHCEWLEANKADMRPARKEDRVVETPAESQFLSAMAALRGADQGSIN